MSKQMASNYEPFWHDKTLAHPWWMKTDGLNRSSIRCKIHIVGNVKEREKERMFQKMYGLQSEEAY